MSLVGTTVAIKLNKKEWCLAHVADKVTVQGEEKYIFTVSNDKMLILPPYVILGGKEYFPAESDHLEQIPGYGV